MRGTEFAFGHPLPLPTSISSPLPAAVALDHGPSSTLASASASVSSSGSSEDAPDFPFYRFSEPVNKPSSTNGSSDFLSHRNVIDDSTAYPRGRAAPKTVSNSPRGRDALKTVSSKRSGSASPRIRGHTAPTSPTHQSAFSLSAVSPNMRQENMRSPPHPLPLPPSSPTSSSSSASRSPNSQWKKGKLLGRGTFGHVYIGFNSETGQMCAIKEVKNISDDVNSRESLRQLNQELALLSQLSHTNIVQYYGSELADDTLSVYLEYVSGGSIHKLLQEYGPFSEPVIRNYTAQILSGLAYLHGRNTVHRDIKGANILVGPSGEIKLADFGMAKHISKYTSIRSFKGSPYWMAPEVIMNVNGYNLAVDMWSLGCTVLEMATAKPPWSQFEGVAAIFKIGNSRDLPEIPDHLSSDGKDFIRQCLKRDPSARPSAAELMMHPFVRVQATTRSARFNVTREILPFPDGNHALSNMELSFPRYTSPHHDPEICTKRVSGFPLASSSPHRITSDIASVRMNMSLPVSPCSSPLRQFGQPYRSCIPSPPHPVFSPGGVNCDPFAHSLYPFTRPSNEFSDPGPDFSQLRVRTAHDSPRRQHGLLKI